VSVMRAHGGVIPLEENSSLVSSSTEESRRSAGLREIVI
jgi:hypothetical protein